MRQPAPTSVQSVAPSSRGFSVAAPRGEALRASSSQGPPSMLMWSLPLPLLLDPARARQPRFRDLLETWWVWCSGLVQSLPQVPRHQLHEQYSSHVTWLDYCRHTHGSMCLQEAAKMMLPHDLWRALVGSEPTKTAFVEPPKLMRA